MKKREKGKKVEESCEYFFVLLLMASRAIAALALLLHSSFFPFSLFRRRTRGNPLTHSTRWCKEKKKVRSRRYSQVSCSNPSPRWALCGVEDVLVVVLEERERSGRRRNPVLPSNQNVFAELRGKNALARAACFFASLIRHSYALRRGQHPLSDPDFAIIEHDASIWIV